MTKIKANSGGATLWARSTIESDIFYNKPAAWFKIFFYIVQKVNYYNGKQLKRGEGYFCFTREKEGLKWVKETQWHKCIKWLKLAKMITTHKTTRGNIIFVLNYDKYQTINTYKGEAQGEAQIQAQSKHSPSTVHTITDKDYKDEKKDNIPAERRETIPGQEFNQNAYLVLMHNDSKMSINIIANFIEAKDVIFPTKKAVTDFIGRNIRVATQLTEFSEDQVEAAFNKVMNDKFLSTIDWGLETILKQITKL